MGKLQGQSFVCLQVCAVSEGNIQHMMQACGSYTINVPFTVGNPLIPMYVQHKSAMWSRLSFQRA